MSSRSTVIACSVGGIGTGEQALLGQNFLHKLELTQDGDRLILRAGNS